MTVARDVVNATVVTKVRKNMHDEEMTETVRELKIRPEISIQNRAATIARVKTVRIAGPRQTGRYRKKGPCLLEIMVEDTQNQKVIALYPEGPEKLFGRRSRETAIHRKETRDNPTTLRSVDPKGREINIREIGYPI